MSCKCCAQIQDPERKARFAGIFEDDWIPVAFPVIAGNATTNSEDYEFYKVDKSRLTKEQIEKIAARLSPVFHISVEEIIKDFENPEFVIPLKADSCMMMFCELHTRMMVA